MPFRDDRRAIKKETVKRYQTDDHNQLRRHVPEFVGTANVGLWLMTINGNWWNAERQRSNIDIQALHVDRRP